MKRGAGDDRQFACTTAWVLIHPGESTGGTPAASVVPKLRLETLIPDALLRRVPNGQVGQGFEFLPDPVMSSVSASIRIEGKMGFWHAGEAELRGYAVPS